MYGKISLKRNNARRREEHGRFQWLEKERLCRESMERFSRIDFEEPGAFRFHVELPRLR